MHRIALLAVPPVTAAELSIPEMALGLARVDGRPCYEVVPCTTRAGTDVGTGTLQIVLRHGLEALPAADSVLVVGAGGRDEADPELLGALREAAAGGKRIASVCGSVFVLAQAGLLDGRRATTYWTYAAELRRRFPRVTVQPDVLYLQDGPVVTSAGLAAALDLCLHIVRTDFGTAVANDVARLVLAAPVRSGEQTQLIAEPVPVRPGISLAGTREWALRRLHEPLTLADLARHHNSSVRTVIRRFRAETGQTPLRWLLDQRIDRARELLETTDLALDQVAQRSGIGSVDSLRQHLVRRSGLTPSAYRAAFGRAATHR
ncbi:helix-turn-helix domain-containing protein [Streptomyces hyaluromycini]|uniref:Helix-turn-helix domain-containing protein n=1 Tax=Streptomyces hyaluromycini TaxID=1377993 RepID=A0ABV1X6J8_9ACTN